MINLIAPLPDINRTVTIDGTTQPAAGAAYHPAAAMWAPSIVLNGQGASKANGIAILAPDVVIKGLTIQRFQLDGVFSRGARTRIVGVHTHGNAMRVCVAWKRKRETGTVACRKLLG